MSKCKGINDDGTPCTKYASIGFVDGVKIACSKHKKAGMKQKKKLVKCKCGVPALFGYRNNNKTTHCGACQLNGMYNLKLRQCKDCDNYAYYGNENGIKEYCKDHKKDDMYNLEHKKCIFKGCMRSPLYSKTGINAEYCSIHKTQNMIPQLRYKCKFEGCNIIRSFGTDKAEYCKEHSDENMDYLKGSKCLKCDKQPSFGNIGDQPIYCSTHKEYGMIDLRSKLCEFKGCELNASFGHELKKPLYCDQHKLKDMIDVKHITCEECNLKACFNFVNNSPKFCKKHSSTGMIDVTAIRCDVCTIIPPTMATFGIPGNKATKCAQHKTTGMISNPTKRCIVNNCKEIAIYGINKQIHCEDHKEPNEYNLVDRECKSCKLTMILNKDDLCGFCDPTMIKNTKLMKQKEIKSLLDAKKYKYTIYDKIIDSKCGLERPDFLFDCITYCLILEVDENQHTKYNNQQTGTNYDCETVRMFNIFQTIGMKTIFIRYNPDDYKVNGIKQNITKNKRHGILLKCLNTMMKQNPEKLDHLSVVYIYYDDFDEKNIKLQKIDLLYK